VKVGVGFGRDTHIWSSDGRCLNINISTGGIELVTVELPAPLHNNVSGFQVCRQFKTTTTRPNVGILALVGAILVVEFGNNIIQKLKLCRVLLRIHLGQSNCYRLVLLTRNSMVLGRPANTEFSTGLGDSLNTCLTAMLIFAIIRC
jgi:hypothetical protein